MKPSDYKISLDILESQSQYSLPMKKGDTARVVYITLREGGVPYEIGTDCFAVLSGRKPDGTVLENNCVIKGNTIIYTITPQTTSASGLVDCEIKLYGVDNGLICSARFSIIVDKRVVGDEEVESSSEFTALTNLYNDVTASENERIIAEQERVIAEEKRANAVAEAFSEKFNNVGTGKNLFNPNDENIVVGKLFNDNGELTVTNASYLTSGYIEVEEGKTYFATVKRNETKYSVIRSHAFYDENKNFISGSGTNSVNGQITIPTEQNVKYIRFSTYSTNYGGNEWQFEADTRTDYEAYHLVYGLKGNVKVPYLDEDMENLEENLNNFKEEIKNNEKFIKTSATINLVDVASLITGQVFDDTTGALKSISTMASSNPIEIDGFDKIVFQSAGNQTMPRASIFYDKDMNIVAHYSTVPKEGGAVLHPEGTWQSANVEGGSVCIIPIPEGAFYYAFSTQITLFETLLMYGIKGENVIPLSAPYKEYVEAYRPKQSFLPVERYIKSYFNGKKLVAIGDSITKGTGLASTEIAWSKQVASMFNMTFVNYGIGGSELAKNKTDGSYDPMCIRYTDMDDDADLIIVAGGTNDWGHIAGNTVAGDTEYQMGEFGDSSINTFYGALDTMCRGLLTKYVGKTIFFMTPIKRYSALSTPYYVQNNRGYTLEDYANAIKKVCGFYGIPVLDMFNECSLNPIIEAIQTAYITDGTHPNFAGHRIMARQVAGFISSLSNDIDYS